MATYSKQFLSGNSGSNGQQIKISAASALGTPIVHAAVSGTADMDEVWLWACNSNSVGGELTVEWGASAAPDNELKMTIPPKAGYVLVVPGMLLNNGASIRCYAASANLFMVNGFANR